MLIETRKRGHPWGQAGNRSHPIRLEALCSGWPGVSRHIQWDVGLLMSVGGEMFALTPSDGSGSGRLSVQMADHRFLELTDQTGIIPALYLARARRVTIIEPADLSSEQLEPLVLDAYTLVRMKLTRRVQAGFGPLPTLNKDRA